MTDIRNSTRKILTILMGLLVLPLFLAAQIRPVEGLHVFKPDRYLLTDARIITAPGKVIARGSILIEDGRILAVGRRIKDTAGARSISMDGRTIYSGFIDMFWEAPVRQKAEISENGSQDANRHWNSLVRPARNTLQATEPDTSEIAELRALGFAAAQIFPNRGIFRGRSVVVHLGTWLPQSLVVEDIAQAVAFERRPRSEQQYPASLLGSVALIRQSFIDARWYAGAWGIYRRYPDRNEQPEVDHDLAALADDLAQNRPFLFIAGDELDILRALDLASENGVPIWIAGNGYEYRRIHDMQTQQPFIILPLNFPAAPQVGTLEEDLQVSLAQLRHWDQSADNPARLAAAGIPFALTSSHLQERKRFKHNLSRSIQRGLSRDAALAALTTVPAEKLGLEATHGKIAAGYAANLVIVDGDYFVADSKVEEVWIAGERFEIAPRPAEKFAGVWELSFPLVDGAASVFGLNVTSTDGKLTGILKWQTVEIPLSNLNLDGNNISWAFNADSLQRSGIWRCSGVVSGDSAWGQGVRHDGAIFGWQGRRIRAATTEDPDDTDEISEQPSNLVPLYPDGAFGRSELPEKVEWLIVRNATIWTVDTAGIMVNADLLVHDGRIAAVGQNLEIPKAARKRIIEIDATGKHVTPGLIDAHSHTALLSINEGTQAVTAEVRIRDVIDSDDIAIYRELAGGLTMMNCLHGSANPIGGQNAVLKLKWGAPPADLIDPRAPAGIKFALGENVKQSNWGDKFTTRYPQTRLGVDQIIRDAFRAAQDYRQARDTYDHSKSLQKTTIAPRRDLELEALVQIMDSTRMIHIHSYRQDEILNFLDIVDEFGLWVGSLTHILEGYKVAAEIADRDIGASCFTDWWAYKFEVYDAIPYNGNLMHEVGVVTSYNSDSDELARRLATEAAKAIKYGDLSPEEALKFVTLNPAIQLGMEAYTGSLSEGKDADFVIWSGDPLSTYSRCEQTWIEGARYFDIEEDGVLFNQQKEERAKLIQKALADQGSGGEPDKPQQGVKNRHGCLDGVEVEL